MQGCEDLFRNLYHEYRNSARRKKLVWELPFAFFKGLIKQACFYCGDEPTETVRKRAAYSYPTNGLDRKDSNQGYEVHNVVPCCSTCNYKKRDTSKRDFLEWVGKVYENTRKD